MPAFVAVVIVLNWIGTIDACPAVGEYNKEDDLPFVVETGAKGISVEFGDDRAIESVVNSDDAVFLRIRAGEDASDARLSYSQKGDLPSSVNSWTGAKIH